MGLLVRLVANFVAVLAALYVVNILFGGGSLDIGPDGLVPVAIFTIILMLLNAFLKPILELLALPLNCLTFGLFSLVISAIIFGLAAYFVSQIDLPEPKFLSALLGALIVSVVSGMLGTFTRSSRT